MNTNTHDNRWFCFCGAMLLITAVGCSKSESDKGTGSKSGASVAKGGEVAILAGGSFWGMEEIIRKADGIIDTEVGYIGGSTENPTFDEVNVGDTGHAEAVRVTFDPKRISYEKLLADWYFRMHDPTTLNQQGTDRGTQYRSAVFVTSPEQRKIAEAVKKRVDESKKWHGPVLTEIVDASTFTRATEPHQDYMQKNPGEYMCHFVREDLKF